MLSKRSVSDERCVHPRSVSMSVASTDVNFCSMSGAMRPFASARLHASEQPAGSEVVAGAAGAAVTADVVIGSPGREATGVDGPGSVSSGSLASALMLALAAQPIIPASATPVSNLRNIRGSYHLSGFLIRRTLRWLRMTGSPPFHLRYTEARERHALVRAEPARGLLVLLRPSEPPSTRQALRAIGFCPEGDGEDAPTWIGALDRDLALLHAALGADALLDLGLALGHVDARIGALPSRWPGRFLVHAGVTQRCVVFEGAVASEIDGVVKREVDDWFVSEWTPTTE